MHGVTAQWRCIAVVEHSVVGVGVVIGAVEARGVRRRQVGGVYAPCAAGRGEHTHCVAVVGGAVAGVAVAHGAEGKAIVGQRFQASDCCLAPRAEMTHRQLAARHCPGGAVVGNHRDVDGGCAGLAPTEGYLLCLDLRHRHAVGSTFCHMQVVDP